MPITVLAPKACSVDGLAKMKSRYPNGFIAVVTNDGCAPCGPVKSLITREAQGKIPIVQIRTEEAKCDALLDSLRVHDTPSAVYMKGEKTVWVTRGDKTDEEIKASVAKLLPPKPTKKGKTK